MLPKYVIFPKKYEDLLSQVKIHDDVYMSQEQIIENNRLNEKTPDGREAYKSNVYIP
jgi:hypothetical protein